MERKGALAWRCIGLSLVALVLVGGLSILKLEGSGFGTALVRNLSSLLLAASWLLCARFLLLKTWWPRVALGVLVLALLSSQLGGKAGLALGVFLSGLVLMTRSLAAWRLISARRRAVGFGLGLVALFILFTCTGVWGVETEQGRRLTWLTKLGLWSLLSLIVFWLLSAFHLAVRMRLHFLRLRPKLTISAFLIGFVPLVLVVVLGSLVFYLGLGGSRAQRSIYILESWREMAAGGNNMAGAPFDTTFCWPTSCAQPPATGQVSVAAPDFLEKLSPLVPSGQDTTAWFLGDGNIWLMRWTGPREERSVQAWLLGTRSLEYLSRMVRAGVDVTRIAAAINDGGVRFDAAEDNGFYTFPGRRAYFRELEPESRFWESWRYFGGGLLPIHRVSRGTLKSNTLMVNLRVGWADLQDEYLRGEDNLNVVALWVVVVLAFLFLTIEVFAFFFGVRISEGFVQAVHSLHRGTRALAQGELDTTIDIPNEDEFGDLAASFNEMTVAIRQGRRDALAKERLTREMETAREIQERLLPGRELRLQGFEITGTSIPSREVGGDYFDFILRDQDSIGVAIGDVSGKGMPAALLMSNLQASLHGQVIHPSSVAEVVGLVNNLIVASTDTHMFATFFYGLLDLVRGTFVCANAGHNPPLLLRADGTLETLQTGGLLLGMLPDQEYQQETVTLEPGDVVVLYTDGITEAVGPTAEEEDIEAMFGEEALEEVVRRHAHLPAAGIKKAILEAVARHTEGHEQSDDITLVVIRRQT
ncbi:hypothetical protein CSA17_06110 [bacterium DOLJORAL78_65_58]|nr:MAG: hypothetical protein CSB20_11220 [bacterium DOLZORAL124_64_63]PIE75687.1 MAG: hypothetical protein CSA17_06110 [bacterium DOLJORAL78_65_58]